MTRVPRFAYADPPYPGQSAKHYGDHPDFAGEVDHDELIERLLGYDGWALSTHVPGIYECHPCLALGGGLMALSKTEGIEINQLLRWVLYGVGPDALGRRMTAADPATPRRTSPSGPTRCSWPGSAVRTWSGSGR